MDNRPLATSHVEEIPKAQPIPSEWLNEEVRISAEKVMDLPADKTDTEPVPSEVSYETKDLSGRIPNRETNKLPAEAEVLEGKYDRSAVDQMPEVASFDESVAQENKDALASAESFGPNSEEKLEIAGAATQATHEKELLVAEIKAKIEIALQKLRTAVPNETHQEGVRRQVEAGKELHELRSKIEAETPPAGIALSEAQDVPHGFVEAPKAGLESDQTPTFEEIFQPGFRQELPKQPVVSAEQVISDMGLEANETMQAQPPKPVILSTGDLRGMNPDGSFRNPEVEKGALRRAIESDEKSTDEARLARAAENRRKLAALEGAGEQEGFEGKVFSGSQLDEIKAAIPVESPQPEVAQDAITGSDLAELHAAIPQEVKPQWPDAVGKNEGVPDTHELPLLESVINQHEAAPMPVEIPQSQIETVQLPPLAVVLETQPAEQKVTQEQVSEAKAEYLRQTGFDVDQGNLGREQLLKSEQQTARMLVDSHRDKRALEERISNAEEAFAKDSKGFPNAEAYKASLQEELRHVEEVVIPESQKYMEAIGTLILAAESAPAKEPVQQEAPVAADAAQAKENAPAEPAAEQPAQERTVVPGSLEDVEQQEADTAAALSQAVQERNRIKERLDDADNVFNPAFHASKEQFEQDRAEQQARLKELNGKVIQDRIDAHVAAASAANDERERVKAASETPEQTARRHARRTIQQEINANKDFDENLDLAAFKQHQKKLLAHAERGVLELDEAIVALEKQRTEAPDQKTKDELSDRITGLHLQKAQKYESISTALDTIEAAEVIGAEKGIDMSDPVPTEAEIAAKAAAEKVEERRRARELVAKRVGRPFNGKTDLAKAGMQSLMRERSAAEALKTLQAEIDEKEQAYAMETDADRKLKLEADLVTLREQADAKGAIIAQERELSQAIDTVEEEVGSEYLLDTSRRGYVEAVEGLKQWMKGNDEDNKEVQETSFETIARGWNRLTGGTWEGSTGKLAERIVDETVAELLKRPAGDMRSTEKILESVKDRLSEQSFGKRQMGNRFLKGLNMQSETAGKLMAAVEAKFRYDEYRSMRVAEMRRGFQAERPLSDFTEEEQGAEIARRDAEIFKEMVIGEYADQNAIRAERLVRLDEERAAKKEAADAKRNSIHRFLRNLPKNTWETLSKHPKAMAGWYGKRSWYTRLAIQATVGTGALVGLAALAPGGMGLSAVTVAGVWGSRFVRAGVSVVAGKAGALGYEKAARLISGTTEKSQEDRFVAGLEKAGSDVPAAEMNAEIFSTYEAALQLYARQQAIEQRIKYRKNIAQLLTAGSTAAGWSLLSGGFGAAPAAAENVPARSASLPEQAATPKPVPTETPVEAPVKIETAPTPPAEAQNVLPETGEQALKDGIGDNPAQETVQTTLQEVRQPTPIEKIQTSGFEITRTDNSIWKAVRSQVQTYVATAENADNLAGVNDAQLQTLKADLADGSLSADSKAVLDRVTASAITANNMQNMGINKIGERVLWTPAKSGGVIEFGSGEEATYGGRPQVASVTPGEVRSSFTDGNAGSGLEAKSTFETPATLGTASFEQVPAGPLDGSMGASSAVENAGASLARQLESSLGIDLSDRDGLGGATVGGFLAADNSPLGANRPVDQLIQIKNPMTNQVVTYTPGFRSLYGAMQSDASGWRPRPDQYGMTVKQFVESRVAERGNAALG